MREPTAHDTRAHTTAARSPRQRLLASVPVTEHRLRLAGMSTAVLDGGQGPPVVLLHGPGESAANWGRVVPELVTTHRVVAPDLPAHGATDAPEGPDLAEQVLGWLGELLERTCPSPPVIVGHILGGAIAARFAIDHADRLAALVLVDSLGLGRFRPAPSFALSMIGFLARPNPRSFDRFMRQCSYDLDGLRTQLGEDWDAFVAHNLEQARSPAAKTAGRLFRELGIPALPPEDLERISVPVTLIWGRHDRANRLGIAEAASERYGWPLHVIDASADDPARDRPEAFVQALRRSLPGDHRTEHDPPGAVRRTDGTPHP